MDEITLKPLGPDGIQKRIADIRARMHQAQLGQDKFELPGGASPAAMKAAIGANGSLSPLSPKGPGISIDAPPAPGKLKAMIEKAATDQGIDPALLDSLVSVESSYDPSARSKVGAMGLTQLMPHTATSLGVGDAMDPQQNLNGGAKYLSELLKQFQDPKLALAAYNAGPGAVHRAGGIPNYPETTDYVNKVMSLYEAKKAQ
jgi:soluble lytic murein transglycosylase-like protein